MELPEILINSVEQLSRIPGVGQKTAMRQALLLSNWSPEELTSFGDSIKSLAVLKRCQKCNFFADHDLCSICLSEERGEAKTLCIIESITDCLAIEKSEQYRGRYHILGGVLNPLLGVGPDELNLDQLPVRIQDEQIKEVILAINPSVEGDATCSYIHQILPDNVNVNRIGFGIPMGGSLEYLDAMTITKALENKRKM